QGLDPPRLLKRETIMPEIPVYRIHTDRMKKDKFAAIAEHLRVRGEVKAAPEALFIQDKERALAYALPGRRFARLLLFIDQSQGLGEPVDRTPGTAEAENWTRKFLQRFQLEPHESGNER